MGDHLALIKRFIRKEIKTCYSPAVGSSNLAENAPEKDV